MSPPFLPQIMTREERVLTIEHNRPDAAFDDVGVEFDAAVVEETREPSQLFKP
jgi:hypothetical protein